MLLTDFKAILPMLEPVHQPDGSLDRALPIGYAYGLNKLNNDDSNLAESSTTTTILYRVVSHLVFCTPLEN